MTNNSRLNRWQRVFNGVRFRILVWYFLLAGCTVLISILATREIFCERLKMRIDESLIQEVDRFNVLADEHNLNVNRASTSELSFLFDKFLESYVQIDNEYIFTLLDGNFYKSNTQLMPEFITQNNHILNQWAAEKKSEPIHLVTAQGHRLIYRVEQVGLCSKSRGSVVVIRDYTSDYQTSTEAIFLVIKVTFVILLLFSWLAWFTAGRVLSPLRSLIQTAQSITESDMTQRISVKGKDEIAQLSNTFNEMLDRLQFAFASQQEFLKDAGHELRTPITVIQGHLELLSLRPDKQDKIIALVIDELSRMNRLVNDLLLLAKTERPDFLNPKPEELDWLTEEFYVKARAIAPRNWRLESKGLSPIFVDRQRLTQAVMNLVQNAVRHSKEGDTITLGSTVRNDYAYFWVRDTGEGIAPEDQERIFERFVRATQTDRYSEGEGAGLGLSIVQAIAHAHGGWVELESTLGYGSTFMIVLPLTGQSKLEQDEPHSHRRRQPSHQRISRSRIASTRVHDSGR